MRIFKLKTFDFIILNKGFDRILTFARMLIHEDINILAKGFARMLIHFIIKVI